MFLRIDNHFINPNLIQRVSIEYNYKKEEMYCIYTNVPVGSREEFYQERVDVLADSPDGQKLWAWLVDNST